MKDGKWYDNCQIKVYDYYYLKYYNNDESCDDDNNEGYVYTSFRRLCERNGNLFPLYLAYFQLILFV